MCFTKHLVSGATIALCQGPEHQILCTVSLFIHTVFMLDFVPRTDKKERNKIMREADGQTHCINLA